ncbi:MAG: hypothetical protein PHX18_03475 [Candidatus Gastranaerophilales bacterium]|nr:hypothetical protein [Candidatus Gastranaerophilales bacterium]
MHKENLNKREILEKITPVIENACMKNGLVPIEIDFQKESGRWFLRIFIFNNEHPVNLEDCENLTRSIDNFLDEIIPVKYNLEVSSPGLERKLKSSKEYTIFKGKKVKLKLREENLTKVIFGRILDFQKNQGLLVTEEETKEEILIKEENILNAQLCFE